MTDLKVFEQVKDYLFNMLSYLVDDTSGILIEEGEPKIGFDLLLNVRVSKDDVGKVIGKEGRIASSLRTLVKAYGAKNNVKVMLNIFDKPAS